jgi:hypothetical protein
MGADCIGRVMVTAEAASASPSTPAVATAAATAGRNFVVMEFYLLDDLFSRDLPCIIAQLFEIVKTAFFFFFVEYHRG